MSVPLSGIICTVGPSSQRADVLLELIRAGMRVVRMNFSHGSHEYHSKTIQEARKAIAMYQEETGLPKAVALALDTKGPEIRTGMLAGSSDKAEVELKTGDKVTLSTNKDLEKNCTKEKIFVDYQQLASIVKPGNHVFLDDGLIALVVKESKGEEVVCEVENGGKLGSHKGVNLPGVAVDLPALTERDRRDLQFGAEQKVDMIFASFIRDAKALADIRQALGPAGDRIKVISKIENQQGLTNIDEIILASDGIMVARGDLGIEIPSESVPLAQKSIIAKCNKVGKPVICATQMLDSMTTKPRPSRAEVADVANAILDGADAVMLSGETAKGKYPAEAVRVMAKICAKMESVLWYESIQNNLKREIRTSGGDHISAVTTSIAEAATVGQARAIVVASPCSMVAQMVSHMRPPCPIVMLTGCPFEAAQSVVFRGIYPLLVEDMVIGNLDFQQVINSGLKLMIKMDIIEPGQKGSVVLVNAMSAEKVSFRLFTFQQPTKAEREQKERCKKLALEQRCKKRAEKETCRKLNEEENCRKLLEADKCKANEKSSKAESPLTPDSCKIEEDRQKCKRMELEEKCKLAEEKEKEKELKCQQLKEEERQKKIAEKCKRMALEEKCKLAEEKEKEQELKCKQLKEKERQKKIAEKCKRKALEEKCKLAEEKEKEQELKCQQLKEKERQKKIAEKCKRMALEEKCKLAEEKEEEKELKCQQLKEEERQKQKTKECKRMALEAKCKLAAEQEKVKEQLKIIKEETAKLEAAQKAMLAQEESKKKEDLEKCQQLAQERKKKEQEKQCKRLEEEENKADMADKWKQLKAERKKKNEAELCKKLEQERIKAKKELAKKALKAVCKRITEVTKDKKTEK
ncbi:pyruvate kinase [Drosophila kikkawai]|uniref:Pyruvate kinase n=1 Tax=Drosophila kikkawai TaxID=30033 RepID=A0A6P4ILZ4_DROKI|nr:pyruvate kinase [Drosophila kikkawai]